MCYYLALLSKNTKSLVLLVGEAFLKVIANELVSKCRMSFAVPDGYVRQRSLVVGQVVVIRGFIDKSETECRFRYEGFDSTVNPRRSPFMWEYEGLCVSPVKNDECDPVSMRFRSARG